MANYDNKYTDLYEDTYGTLIPITTPGGPGATSGPTASVIEAISRRDPAHPYGGTALEQGLGLVASSYWPFFPSFATDVLFLPSFTLLDADVQVSGSLSSLGLPGATAGSRYVGATISGAPVTGTFTVGDFVIDQTGTIWICISDGSPGTWTEPLTTLSVVNLIDASTISVDASQGNDFRLVLGGNHFLASPINPVDGQKILFEITQSSGGPYTLSYDTGYDFGDGLPAPVLSTRANTTDILGFVYNAAPIGRWLFVSFMGGFAQPLVLSNTFEGGTNTTALTTGNSGGISGNAFDSVSIGSGGTLAFSNTHAVHGQLSMLCQTTTANSTFFSWSTSLGTQNMVWFRVYLYFPGLPSGISRFYTTSAGGAGASRWMVLTNGKIQVQDINGTVITTSTSIIPTGTWFRVEGFTLASITQGQTETKLFTSADGTTPLEVNTSPATQNLASSITTVTFGPVAGTANQGPYYMDDIGISLTGYLGSASSVAGSSLSGASAMTSIGSIQGAANIIGTGTLSK